MQDFNTILTEQFSFVKALTQKENKTLLVLRHNYTERKVVKLTFCGDASVYKTLQKISHPNLPEIFSVSHNGTECTVIEEYIDGITVADVLQSGLYNEKGTRTVASDICCALDALHKNNIIHRDIKPENVMIDKSGTVKLIDFDAARLFKAYQPRDTSFIGTVGFAAPEQYGINQSDPRTDIFALGVLMNVMLTGEHPSKKMYRGKLTKTIETCINIDPNRRYKSTEELFYKLCRLHRTKSR